MMVRGGNGIAASGERLEYGPAPVGKEKERKGRQK